MKKIILISMTIFFVSNLFGQSVEIYGNGVYSSTHYKFKKQDYFKGHFTSSFGLNYNFESKKKLNYMIGLSYDKKGADYENMFNDFIINRFDFITLKGLARWNISPNYELQFGAYTAFLTNLEVSPTNSYTQEFIDNSRNNEVGISLNIQQLIFTKKQFEGYIKVESNYGLTTIWKGYSFFGFESYRHNITLGLGLAVRWNFKEE
jgi:hypothetical protein|tara:strand:- start:132 stop:746 length:615 start_codon:yes stop_codon:yes gene_type:complete